MGIRKLASTMAIVASLFAATSASQLPGLNAGTVTATVGGSPFTATVSLATMRDGKLVLTNLSNLVQIQVPNAKPGTFAIKLDADGGLIDVIVGLKVGNRIITPVSGSLTIETLNATTATGRFEFAGKDVGSEAPVRVTDGRFQVKLIGGA